MLNWEIRKHSSFGRAQRHTNHRSVASRRTPLRQKQDRTPSSITRLHFRAVDKGVLRDTETEAGGGEGAGAGEAGTSTGPSPASSKLRVQNNPEPDILDADASLRARARAEVLLIVFLRRGPDELNSPSSASLEGESSTSEREGEEARVG